MLSDSFILNAEECSIDIVCTILCIFFLFLFLSSSNHYSTEYLCACTLVNICQASLGEIPRSEDAGLHGTQTLSFTESESCSVVSDSLWPHGLHSPWNSLGQNTGVGSLSPLQRIFPTQESNPGLLRWRRILYQLSSQGNTAILLSWVTVPAWCYWMPNG